MTNYIPMIAKPDKRDRFDAIVKVLTGNGVPYTVQPLPYPGALGNIIVTPGGESSGKKTAVTAHYDNISGMPGANDNAAACSILLNVILELKASGKGKGIEFVFFDLEEAGFKGSKYYYAHSQRDDLLMVFNLDMCGMGTNTVVSLHNGAEKLLPHSALDGVHVLKMLPPGDAYTFIYGGVPTVYVINSTDRDLPWFTEFARTGLQPAGFPDFAYTMHGPNDTPDTCNPGQVGEISRFILGCL